MTNRSVTHVRQERHECNRSATRTTRVQHQCYTKDTNATRVRNFDFDNDMSENIFSHSLQGEEQFYFKNYFLSCSHAKMRLKSAPQKLNFVMAKAISKGYTLDRSYKCPCKFRASYT